MRKYKDYMDGVEVSDTLHKKLKNLEKPGKKAPAWQRYGALAAALVLVVGLGVWAFYPRDNGGGASIPSIGQTELGDPEPVASISVGLDTDPVSSAPAIEPAPGAMPGSPGMETMGGYEVNYGETVAYFMLPYIQYGKVETETNADIALPVGVTRRDLTNDELLALLGGESNLTGHLDWGGYAVSAFAMVWPDDSLWMLCIHGTRGEGGQEHFALEVMPGQLPPSCIVYPESAVNNIWEREVTACRYDGQFASTLRVSFLDRDHGYRFSITGAADSGIDERASRLVRWIIVGDGLTLEETPEAGSEELTTSPYDPAASRPPANEGASTPAYEPN